MAASPVVERPPQRPAPPARRRPAGPGAGGEPAGRTGRRAAALGACLLTACVVFLALPVQPDSREGGGSQVAQPEKAAPRRARPTPSAPSAVAASSPLTAYAFELDSRIAEPWVDLQARNGRFRNELGGATRYGEATLGYALVQAGARGGDDEMVRAGLKALRFAVAKSHRHSRPSVFENLAVASAYNLGRRSLAHNRLWRRTKDDFARFLKTRTSKELQGLNRYDNHFLADAIAVLEIQRTGLVSKQPDAVLGPNRAVAAAAVDRLINQTVPRMAAQHGVMVRGRRTFVLSDPPDNPLAYQGLSLGMYARAVKLLGDKASPAARRTLREGAQASWWLTAPDGTLGYMGRSQEEAWSLTATTYGAALAANQPGVGERQAANLRALVQRVLERLDTAYGTDEDGLNITPAVRKGGPRAENGLDGNSGQPSFTGLTLMMLNWTLPELRKTPPASDEIGSDRHGGVVVSAEKGRLAVVRDDRVWYAVKMTPSGGRPDDLRYDFGVLLLKVRGAGGRWVDVAPQRPRTGAASSGGYDSSNPPPAATPGVTAAAASGVPGVADSAGPVLLGGPSGPAYPYGDRMSVARDGTVRIAGGFRAATGAIVRSGVTFAFRPLRDGVRITAPRAPADTMEYSAFFTGRRPHKGRRSLRGSHQLVHFGQRAAARVHNGYASAIDPVLFRGRLRFPAPGTADPLRIDLRSP
ncbi:MAG TPA: hypothetical protein VK279_02170 [Solirubrobacteraceae bacterium]|nr:hypothetical protein [Solirubrobacteraceae bacterium]